MRMRLAPIVMAAVLWPGALPAQSDDPAIVVCEAREGPKPEELGLPARGRKYSWRFGPAHVQGQCWRRQASQGGASHLPI